MNIFLYAFVSFILFWNTSTESHRGFLDNTLIKRVAQETGVPAIILKAIAACESGVGKKKIPWVWSLNCEGRSYYCNSQSEMKSKFIALLKSGKTNIDIGPLQINWRWHGKRFESIDEATNPYKNILLAASFLKDLHKEFGSWGKAVGAYHSRNKDKSKIYVALVVKQFKRMGIRVI